MTIQRRTMHRAGLPLACLLMAGASALPASASPNTTQADAVKIVSAKSNLISSADATAAAAAKEQPPPAFRIYEKHFYEKKNCEARGLSLYKLKVIDDWWCTKTKQANDRHWLYVKGCSTDSVQAGGLIAKNDFDS